MLSLWTETKRCSRTRVTFSYSLVPNLTSSTLSSMPSPAQPYPDERWPGLAPSQTNYGQPWRTWARHRVLTHLIEPFSTWRRRSR
jgi:hypothetical protein